MSETETKSGPRTSDPESTDLYVFPMSYAQQRLWFLDQLEPGSIAYNTPFAIQLTGKLNVGGLEQALTEILRRHEVLRTNFRMVRGEPVQIVRPLEPVRISIVDLSSLPQAERELRATTLAAEEARRPFDLGREPMLRLSLLRLSSEQHVLLLTTHHIVFDGWSRGVLFRELGPLYECFCSGKPSPLPELPIQYTDFAVWQRDYLSGEALAQQLGYWRQQLAGALKSLEVPTDRPRPTVATYRGSSFSTLIAKDVVQRLKNLAEETGTTLFMTLLAAFNVLLSRHTGQNDIVVGSPIANRNRAELEDLIGFFANTLVLRTDLSGEPTFLELLKRTRETALGAYAHQDLPFEKLVEELNPERNLSHNPLFQVILALRNVPKQSLMLSGLQFKLLQTEHTTAKTDIALFLSEGSDGIAARWEYNTDLFDVTTIERIASHFENLLEGITADPNRTLASLPMLSETERTELLFGWNETQEFPVRRCIHQLFEEQARRVPEKVALVFEGQTMTYAELNARSNQLAHYLRRMGVGRDVLVGLCVERSLEMVVGILGIAKAGGAYLPLDPRYPKDRLAFMVEDAKPTVVLTQYELQGSLPAVQGQVVTLDADWAKIEREDRAPLVCEGRGESLAYVIYTSGSTGRPKGCQITHANVVRLFEATRHWYEFDEHDVWTLFHSYAFDFSVWELWGGLIYGGRVVVVPYLVSRSPEEFYHLLESQKVTVLNQTPSSFRQLMHVEEMLGTPSELSLRYVIFGGEALEMQSLRPWFERHGDQKPRLVNMYGITETTVHVTYRALSIEDTASGSVVGRPIPDLQVYLLDQHLQPVPIGVPGEMYVGGAGVARGYLNRPALNAERFIPDLFRPNAGSRLYRSGDLARRLANGDIEYLGRIDQQVKIRGFRIELGEIESVLTSHPSVRDAVVTVREDVPGDKRLVAYVVPFTPWAGVGQEIAGFLKQELPPYMVPSTFVPLDALPLTENGKVDRKALPAPEWRSQDTITVAPRNDTEETLAGIWKQVLNLPSIGVTDNFFDIGGHSILAVRLLMEIERITGKKIPVATLFQGATIEYLAKVLREEVKASHETVVKIQDNGAVTPFFAIVVPGVNAVGYFALARHLGEDLPMYKVQGPGMRVSERPYTPQEFRDMAAAYVDAVKAVQPTGPYYLGGMCEGARIAFEMACLLEARGDKVGFLAIFDTWVVENSQVRWLWKVHYFSGRLKRFVNLSRTHQWQMISKWARQIVTRDRPRSLWPAAYWPSTNFVPQKFGGRITVFKRPKQPFYHVRDPLLGWGGRTTGEVEVQLIESKHRLLLREPYVRELAEKLKHHLQRARAEEPQATAQLQRQAATVSLFSGNGQPNFDISASPGSDEPRKPAPIPAISDSRSTVSQLGTVLWPSKSQEQLMTSTAVAHAERGASAFPHLSVQQRRLWVLDQLEQSDGAHNVSLFLQIKGALDPRILEKSFNLVLARHETLRSRFLVQNGDPIRVVFDPEHIELGFEDLTSLPTAERADRARELGLLELHQPFDLQNGPLLRALLLRLGRDEHVLALVAHQIVCDYQSTHILMKEMVAYYETLVKREKPVRPKVSPQYSDYVKWQEAVSQSPAFATDLKYWKQRLAGTTGMELPTDHIRPRQQSFRGSARSLVLDYFLVDRLRELSRREGVSLDITLCAAFLSLLSRYSGSEDITIGTEVSGRNHPETADLIGRFSNYLILRADSSDNPTFGEWLSRVQRTWTEARQHQNVPFGILVENMRLQRDMSRNPLFQVMFAVQEPLQELSTAEVRFAPLQTDSGTEILDLALRVTDHTTRLEAQFSYSTDLFAPTTIERMMGHFVRLLEAVAESPEQRLSDLSLLSDDEQHRLLVEWNSTQVDYPRDIPLHEFIEKQVQQIPGAPALVCEGGTLTYRELNARANQLAHRLRRLGVGPDVLVGVCAERSLEMVVALLGVVKAGGAYVPLDPEYPHDRLESMLEDAQPPVVLTQAHLLGRIPKTTGQTLCLDRDWEMLETESRENLERVVSGKNLVYAIYTSGSTGKPKGVGNVHEAIVNRLLWMQDTYRLTPGDRVLQKTPYSFDVSVWEFFWPLMNGACLVVARPGGHKDPSYLVELIQEQRITTLHFVPSMLGIFLETAGVEGCTSIRQVFASGEALPYELKKRFFQRLRAELHNLYGPTEAAVDVTYWRCRPEDDRPIVPIGRPVANTQIYILDRNLQPVPIGVAGELHIGGIQLARGYLNRPDLTAEKFILHPWGGEAGARLYKTGDLARFLPDGNLEYLGRLDHQVKLRGFRIELGEIEAVLAEHAPLRHAVVMVREDTPGDKRLVAYLTPAPAQSLDLSQVRNRLRAKLPEFMVPSKFVILDTLPVTASGKLDRKALPAPSPEPRDGTTAVAARNEMENLVVSAFRTILGVNLVSVTDDFFDLGGQSLMAARLVSHLQKATGRQIPLSLLFRGATPEYLARVLRDGVDLPPEPIAVPIVPGDSGPIFFAVVPPGENALGYAKLARYMGRDQRFYKLQGRGEVLADRPYSNAEMQSLADEYVNAMCAVQPEGPYHFGGLCDGAHIALRMAHRLEGLGQEVGTLAVFDTWVLEHSQRRVLWYLYYYSQRFREYRNLPLSKKFQVGLRGLRNAMKKILRPSRQRSLWSETYWPDKNFVPPSFSGRVTLFKRPEQPYYYVEDPKMGWGARAAGGVDVQILPIRHAEMLQEPHVRILAHHLRECLKRRLREQAAPTTRQDDLDELAFSGGEATSGAS